jgi:hypothetical protein
MSDTPETDDQPIINAINDNGYQVPCVDIDFARKLEQERDEAREKYDNLATEHMLVVNKLCNERDQARNLAEFFHHDQTRLLIENANPKTITKK